ncbi:MAG: hypothetical protein IT258_03485 [Saprospiraceae bacterium]|nr:hypothetical protein [Saprospiraceae bacterium]
MKTASVLLTLLLATGLAGFILVKKFAGSKPAFYAKIIAKQAEHLLQSDTVNWTDFDIRIEPYEPYAAVCQRAKTRRTQLASKTIQEAGSAFETMLLNEIIPHWYGTEWDFFGHTDTPGQGKVACGYFVSTTLQHLGVNVNRFHLAQQTPLNEANTLAAGTEVIEISGESTAENLANIKKAIGEGICFVGLGSSHVGFLVKRRGELFFAHSSYLSPGTVTIEKAAWSPVFCAYDQYYIVELSNNKAFVKKWLNNEKLKVIKHQ